MTLLEAEKIAQEIGFDSAKMIIISPGGQKTEVQWGDAYMGIIIMPSGKNFTTTRDLHDMHFTVEKVFLSK